MSKEFPSVGQTLLAKSWSVRDHVHLVMGPLMYAYVHAETGFCFEALQ